MLNPLDIGCILESVFQFLPVQDLKYVRQVSKLFNEEATKQVIKKSLISIPKDFHVKSECDQISETRIVFDFLSSESNELKVQGISISDIRDIDILFEICLFNPNIKYLKYTLHQGYGYRMGCENKLERILDLLPNLEYLDTSTNFKSVMTTLDRNLFRICNERVKNGKISNKFTISHLVLFLHPSNSMDIVSEAEQFEKFADGPIKIQNLLVHFTRPIFEASKISHRFIRIINKILLNSQNTLEKIQMDYCEKFLHHLDFPNLPLLKHLKVTFYLTSSQISNLDKFGFSNGFKFSKQLPNLSNFDLTLDGDLWSLDNDVSILNRIFEHTGVAESVKTLGYSNLTGDLNLEKLFKTFSHVENLELFHIKRNNFKNVAPFIWKFCKKLKSLEFYIEKLEFSQLDSILTGFSMETVKILRNNDSPCKMTIDEENLNELRKNSSILDLPDLESLTINTNARYDYCQNRKSLAIADRFVFQLIPKLEIVYKNYLFGQH